MKNQAVSLCKKQEHILKVLNFLSDGGDFTKGSGFLEKAKNDRCDEAKIAGHPLNTLYLENDAITDLIQADILPTLKRWQQDGKNDVLLAKLQAGLKKLRTIKFHYERKENTLYTFFVKDGLISEDTSSQMWGVNDKVLEVVKDAYTSLTRVPIEDKYLIESKIESACQDVLWIIFIENTIFIPILSMITTADQWYVVKQDELEIGYTLIDNPASWVPSEDDIRTSQVKKDNFHLSSQLHKAYTDFLNERMTLKAVTPTNDILRGDKDYLVGQGEPELVFPNLKDTTLKMDIGSLSLEEIPAIFNVLPIDLTFVDKYDNVKWFSNTDRVFPRTRSVIGRPVIRCHPPKSIDKVLKILDDFHKAYADSEDFWVTMRGRTIYLCFYAVRDQDDNYLGCLETVQDITKFKAMVGQKTLENKDQFKD